MLRIYLLYTSSNQTIVYNFSQCKYKYSKKISTPYLTHFELLLIIYRSLRFATTNNSAPITTVSPWIPGATYSEEDLFNDSVGNATNDDILHSDGVLTVPNTPHAAPIATVLPVTPVPIQVPAEPVPVPAAPVKKRKKRKKKDKNAPKKAKNDFLFFSMSSRPRVELENPGFNFIDIAKHIGQLWRSMSIEDKAIFQEMADKDKVRYQTEVAAYRAKQKNKALGQVVDIETADTIQIWDGPTFEDKFAEGAANAIDLTGDD